MTTATIVDLSHRIRTDVVTYPGMPTPEIRPFLTRADSQKTYAPGTEFAMDWISMIGNTGTYLDSPYHRYPDGRDLADLDLATLVDLPTRVINVVSMVTSGCRGISESDLSATDVPAGGAVLFRTGWSHLYGTPEYGTGAPFLTEDAVRLLIEREPALVGIDSLNIDDTESGGERPAHSLLLEAGIHIVEHLTNLDQVPITGARFTAAPPAIVGFGTFPVRALIRIPV